MNVAAINWRYSSANSTAPNFSRRMDGEKRNILDANIVATSVLGASFRKLKNIVPGSAIFNF
jgi:hypothetical protein